MSALPQFTMRQLLDAGVHFGHQTMRWNPKMAPYIYGSRNNVHIIDLRQTVPYLHKALEVVRDVAAKNGRILFVGTKRQASPLIAEAAKRCGQYYVNHRWLGGTLTNWNTVSESIKTLRSIEEKLNDRELIYSKKEKLDLERQLKKLELFLGGIKDMGGRPDLLFIIDTNKEKIAVAEAQKLGIPIVAVVDSNSNPDGIDYIIPGNDDATRSVHLYCNLVSNAILSGMQTALSEIKVERNEDKERSSGSRNSDRKPKSEKGKKDNFAKKEENKSEESSASAEDSKEGKNDPKKPEAKKKLKGKKESPKSDDVKKDVAAG